MKDTQSLTRLHSHMAALVVLEQIIDQRIKQLMDNAAHDPKVTALLEDLEKISSAHGQTLGARLHSVAPGVSLPEPLSATSPLEVFFDSARYPLSTGLLSLQTLFHQAVIGYSVLMVLARRAADSSVRGSDNTDDILLQHLRESAAAVQQIVRLLPGVVVAELEDEGQECQCTCPSCGVGICLCAVSTRRMLEIAWADAGAIYVPEGIVMVLPRSGSPAAQAGLRKGDIVLAVDDKIIESLPMLQETIRNHPTGENIRLLARRESGEQTEIVAKQP